MAKDIAQVSVTISAPASKVWDWLTKPELVKQYFFETNLEGEWKTGGEIRFRGEWQGKPYEDKGKVVAIQPAKHLTYLYWSSFSGTVDSPENYQRIDYDLLENFDQTRLTVRQECILKSHCESNWRMVLDGLKKAIEGTNS